MIADREPRDGTTTSVATKREIKIPTQRRSAKRDTANLVNAPSTWDRLNSASGLPVSHVRMT